MIKKFRILLTKQSFEALLSTPTTDRETVSLFLNYLMEGGWEEGSLDQFNHIMTWKKIDNDRCVFSCKIKEGLFAVWEVLWTVDLANQLRLREYMEKASPTDFSLHILLYSFGEFPGQPDTLMHLRNEDFQVEGPIEKQYLGYYDRKPEDEIEYNEELYLLASRRIESVLKGEQRGLPLHMTKEQVDILSTHRILRGPILLSGEAGSGKTTVITYWLIINELEEIRPQLFVTFSERLTERTKIEFEQMLPPALSSHGVRFLTYRDLLWEIANAGGLTYREKSKEMTFERFLREYSYRVSSHIDRILLWDEIRSVIKGGSTDPNKRMIDFSSYEQLSEKRGRCKTPQNMRELYYKEAQNYQNYLDKEGLWDGIDLAFDCLSCVNKISPYEKIACDEVQDLAPIEIQVLINLVKKKNIDSIFFTGDTAQVINPSGFSWSKLKGDLGYISKRHDIRDAWALHRNFRSTSEIVELVNEIIRIREQVLDDASERNIQHSFVSSGIKPMILESSLLDKVKSAISNPQQRLILVKTKEQKERVIDILGAAREKVTVLTVEEAKGLEWDGVFLWNFFIPRHKEITKNDWENVFIPEKRRAFPDQINQGIKDRYGLTYEFNLLHVGLTRARKFLFIFDEDPNMNIVNLGDTIEDKIAVISGEQFSAHWETKLPAPEELSILASNLLERDREQAFQFFKIAAREFEKINKLEEAARCYENAFEYNLAASCYKKSGNKPMQEKMLAYESESKTKWRDAGNHWEEYSKYSIEKGELLDSLDGYNYAAKAYENSGLFKEASKALEQGAHGIIRQKEMKYIVRRAEFLYNSSIFWEKAGSLSDAIRTMNTAINVGRDEIIKSFDRNLISGKIPEAWVAFCFAKISDYQAKSDKIPEAAYSSMEAARFFKEAERSATDPNEKENYLENQILWLQKSVERYKESGQMKIGIDVQKDLVKLLKNRKKQYKLMKSWESLIYMLRNNGRITEYFDNSFEFIKYLRKIDQVDKAYEIANEQIEWFKDGRYLNYAIELLQLIKTYYEKDELYNRLGKVMEDMGTTQEKLGEKREAMTSFVYAGKNYLKSYMVAKAMKSFTSGKGVTVSELTSSSVGWYCFKDVAIDTLIIDFEEPAKKWVNEAVSSFIIEYTQSVQRIKGYIKILEENIGRSLDLIIEDQTKVSDEKQLIDILEEYIIKAKEALIFEDLRELEENIRKIAWAWLCLANLHREGIKQRITPLGERENMREAYDNSARYFLVIGNKGMASYVEENKNKSD